MALVVADRVKQTAATISGTGTYTLSGTFTGFQTFTDGVGDGNTTYYAAVQDANFEIGIGTYTASGTTLARTTILQSSNSDNAVSWSSATPTIFTTYPADKAVFKDASGNINGTFVGNITGNVTGNTSGTAATVTGAAQTNITSVGTLSSLTTSGDITVGDDLTVNGGQIDLRTDSGAVSKMKFYCEVSNAHAQTLQAQPHSASSSAVLTLPVNTGTLVGTGDSGSVSNTMLAGSIANAKLANSSITVADGSSSTAVALGGTITFAGTSNEVEVGESSGTVTIGLPDNVTIAGNLTVNGTTTTIDTTNTLVKDSLLGLNNGASSNSNDSGIIIERGSTGNDALLIWDESADKWALGTTTSNASSTGNLNMTTGTLVANIEGNVTGNVTGNASGTAATVTGAAQTNITSVGTLSSLTTSGDITVGDDLTVNGGLIDLKTNSGSVAKLKFYCESGNAHAQTLQAQPHSASASDVLTLPTGGNSTLVSRISTDTLTNKTLTSPVLNTGASGTAIKDEDDMASDSATHLATQQSIKAYVDAQKADMQFVLEDGDGTEVQVTKDKEVKFVEGGGLDINWTDTSTGSDGDPYDLTFTVNAAQTGITSLVNTSLEIGRDADNRIKFGTDNQIIFEVSGGDNVIFKASGEIEASSLDISGDADIDGTLEADAITVAGTALATVIAGTTVTDATNSAHVLVTDNESTNEENLITFVEGATSSTGNVGLEMDGNLTYNPSTGRLTATQLAGTLQTAAQANVTSLGTLTTLTVDNVIINGSTIGHTGDTDLMTVASGVLTVAGEVDATSLDISGDADIDGTLEADAITVNGTALNTVIADEATALAIALG